MLAAIILAAGASQRMGGHPKALLEWHDETFLGGILKACYAAGLERRVVVLGYQADRILAGVDLGDVTVVQSEDLDAGPIGSMRAGISAIVRHPVDGALVWPVDRPHVQVSTIEALVQRATCHDRPAIVLPRHAGRRGHPVIFGRAVWDELRDEAANLGAHVVVRREPGRVVHVDVDDPAVVEDVNTPDEYEDLVRRGDSLA